MAEESAPGNVPEGSAGAVEAREMLNYWDKWQRPKLLELGRKKNAAKLGRW